MKVKHWMTKDPISVSPDTLAVEAQKIMKENRIRRLPVVDKGKLVGIVTFRNLIEAAPSSANSLSIHELNYLIMKIKVKDLMKKNVITVSPEDTVIDAIVRGVEKGIGGFPVVDEQGQFGGHYHRDPDRPGHASAFRDRGPKRDHHPGKRGPATGDLWKNRHPGGKIGDQHHEHVLFAAEDHGPVASLYPDQIRAAGRGHSGIKKGGL